MRQILLLFFILFITGCNFITRKKPKENHSETISRLDSVHFLPLLKSYEPAKYKGKVPKDFYSYNGNFDFWRFPLVYPWSINCIDVIDYGGIVNNAGVTDFKAGGSITYATDYFDRFIFDRNNFIGHWHKGRSDSEPEQGDRFIILSFADGEKTEVKGKEKLYKKLRELRFSGDTSFITIREYSNHLH